MPKKTASSKTSKNAKDPKNISGVSSNSSTSSSTSGLLTRGKRKLANDQTGDKDVILTGDQMTAFQEYLKQQNKGQTKATQQAAEKARKVAENKREFWIIFYFILPTVKSFIGIQERNRLLIEKELEDSNKPPSKKVKQSKSILSDDEAEMLEGLGPDLELATSTQTAEDIDASIGSVSDQNDSHSHSDPESEDDKNQDELIMEAASITDTGNFVCDNGV
jgi:hypothetical protein